MNDLLKECKFECRVSSVINKDTRNFGKQCMFDDYDETCWYSDAGLPQWIKITFENTNTISGFEIQFQGGFAGKVCSANIIDDTESTILHQNFYPNDINAVQRFLLQNPATGKLFQLTFNEKVGVEMSALEVSNESNKISGKRQREISSEEETLPTKKSRNSTEQKVPASNGSTSHDSNDDSKKEIKENTNSTNNQESISLCTNNINKKSDEVEDKERKEEEKEEKEEEEEEKEDEKEEEKQEEKEEENNRNSLPKANDSTNETDDEKSNDEPKEDSSVTETLDKSVANENVNNSLKNIENSLDESINLNVTTSSTKETEVVDGLELSVECASDKEDSSSESDKDKDLKPRTKTIIVKAKPNESELEVSSSEVEESEEQNLNERKKNLKQGKQKNVKTSSNVKISGSEDSSDNNTKGEEYKPKNKKKPKKNLNKKTTKPLTVSKRGRGARKVNLRKGNDKSTSNDNGNEDNDDDDDDKDNDIEKNDVKEIAERVTKSVDENKDEQEDDSSGNESSRTESESNDDPDEANDGKKKKRGSNKLEDDKRIKSLKKYIRAAGINVKSYQEIWGGCKSNAAKVRRLKSLLAEHGINGRPTLEKCKKVKEHNERLKEVSELDKSNIISEGRVTRSRRGMDNNKNSIISTETPSRYRETRNAYKRIQTVIDSDSE
ncbi:hypothetical protein M0802_009081 [Mischocyttarus mexicanus]|nr:hypothetical protein M0802_009081 [Mischocyttarus mexicanus]